MHVDIVGHSQRHVKATYSSPLSTDLPDGQKQFCDTTAKDTFVATWVACYGMPSVITTDWGMQFTSATWSGWCEEYGMQRQIICK